MPRILIVDDEERIVNSLWGVLSDRFDAEIHKAYSAVSALVLVKKMRFDLLITDISMPQMTGLELLDETRRLWPQCYVVLLTAYDRFEYAYRAMKYDRIDYLLKIESYDEICRIVQEKLDLRRKEQEEDEKLLRLGDDLNTISQSVSRYFLKRIVVQGSPLPSEKDLAGIRLPMNFSSPALLLLGALDAPAPAERSRVLTGVDEYLAEHLAEIGMTGVSYVSSSGYVFWVFQTPEDGPHPERECVVFLHQLIDDLPALVEKRTGHKLSLLCADACVPWQDLHSLYQRASVQLDRWGNEEGGAAVFSAADESAASARGSTFPNIDEVNMLWEMLKNGNTQNFLAILREGLAPMRQVRQMTSVLNTPTVTGIAFLLSQAAGLYAPDIMKRSDFWQLLSWNSFETGEKWTEAVLRTMEEILQIREASQQNMSVWLIERINQYIEQHYAEDVTLTTLAEEVHYSPSYLSRFYKTHTGTNLQVYISSVRINHAKTLLTTTSLKLSDIAAQCGFCSTKYFNQVFRHLTDISAMQYREQHTRLESQTE